MCCIPPPKKNGPLHYEIASELFDLSCTDLLGVFAIFYFYALVHHTIIEYHHVGGICTSQAAWER